MNHPLLFLVLLIVTSGSAMAWEESPRSGKFCNPYTNKPVPHFFTWDRTSFCSWESPGSRWSSEVKKPKISTALGNKPSCYISKKTLKKLKECKKVIPTPQVVTKTTPPEKDCKPEEKDDPETPTHKVSDSGSTFVLLLGVLLLMGTLHRQRLLEVR